MNFLNLSGKARHRKFPDFLKVLNPIIEDNFVHTFITNPFIFLI
jgi:hypothetical protein